MMKVLVVFALLASLVSGDNDATSTLSRQALRRMREEEELRELSESEDLEAWCGSCLLCDIAGDQCNAGATKSAICSQCDFVPGLCATCEECDQQGDACRPNQVVETGCSICDGEGNLNDDTNVVKVCFADISTVDVLGRGTTLMKDLQVGDQILTPKGSYESVYAFAHYHNTQKAEFLQIYAKNVAQPLLVTGDHLLFKQGSSAPVPAKEIQVGDTLQGPALLEVTKIDTTSRKGVYAPLTNSGTFLVNGVAASSYIHLADNNSGLNDHSLIHFVLAPQRLLCNAVSSASCQTHNYHEESGMPYYVYYGLILLEWLFQANPITRFLGFALVFSFTGICFGMEKMIEAPSMLLWIGMAAAAFYHVTKQQPNKIKTV